jgi:alpha-pyrone synthase
MTTAYLNRIATAVPEFDVHEPFIAFAAGMLRSDRTRGLFRRMARVSGISRRFSVLNPIASEDSESIYAARFYERGGFPSTAERMRVFEQNAPRLAYRTLDRLALSEEERARVTHVVVTSCTGMYAPGLDFEIMDHLRLRPTVERTMIGFMGCYAAMNALKVARHIVRSEPGAAVLVLNLELCTLHLQETQELEQVLSFLVFSDGCAASLVTADETGLALDSFRSVVIPETRDLITWKIRELGFDMLLSGRVPMEIARSLRGVAEEITGGRDAGEVDLWAVHPGGRSVLDAVEEGLGLREGALEASRRVLECFGNMSSATVMFVLEQVMRRAKAGQSGCAMSFGPGLTAETLLFHAV